LPIIFRRVVYNKAMDGLELTNEEIKQADKALIEAGLLEEHNKWANFAIDYKFGITAKKITMHEKLEKAAFDSENFPVPPKPNELNK